MNETQRAAAERLADDLQRFDGAERESLRDEAAALLRELAAEPVHELEPNPLSGTMAEALLQVIAGIWHEHPDYSTRQTLDALNAMFPAEPVQEPVAYVDPRQLARGCASLHCITKPEYRSYADAQAGLEYTPLYLHPPQQRKDET